MRTDGAVGAARRVALLLMLYLADLSTFFPYHLLTDLPQSSGSLRGIAIGAGAFALLYWRHRAPVAVLSALCALNILVLLLSLYALVPLYVPTISVFVAIHTVAARRRNSLRHLPVAALAAAPTALASAAWSAVEPPSAGIAAVCAVMLCLGFCAWVSGGARLARAQYTLQLDERRLALSHTVTPLAMDATTRWGEDAVSPLPRPPDLAGPSDRCSVFINYRREDTANVAGRLYERLADALGDGHVFLDVDSTEIGADVLATVRRRVRTSGVLVMLVGPRWHGPRASRSRLHDPEDLVRIEIEEALRCGIRVVPVLVDDARMPVAGDLPPSIRAVAGRNAARLRYDTFRHDVAPLLATIRHLLADGPG